MAKTTKRKRRAKRTQQPAHAGPPAVVALHRWIVERFGLSGGCMIAQAARRLVQRAVRQRLDVAGLWALVEADEKGRELRAEWAVRLGADFGDPWARTYEEDELVELLERVEAWDATSAAMKQAARAEIRRIDASKVGPRLVGVRFVGGAPRGVWTKGGQR